MLLSNNRNSYSLYDWLKEKGEQVYLYSGILTEEQVLFLSPQLVVSYNYCHLISESIIQLMDNRIINMHISYLPWNRGADPNFWSFIEDTPKGITIHQLSAALDQGNILLQKEIFFDEEKETFKSTYEFLNKEIIKLFKENFYDIKNQQLSSYPQQGAGTSHKRKDLFHFMNGKSINWNETIYSFKKKAERIEGSCNAVYSCGCK